jgi:hypothetical protein
MTDLEKTTDKLRLVHRLSELLGMKEDYITVTELVAVAKEIHTSYGQETWRVECYCPGMTLDHYLQCVVQHLFQTFGGEGWVSANLEAILNQYGRSLGKC